MANHHDDETPQGEPYFAAMAFVMQYQTTADKAWIFEVTKQIRLLWERAEMARARGQPHDQRRALRLVRER